MTEVFANPRPESGPPRRARRGDEGVVLILALFVIMILLVIVPQFRFSANVERELAFNEVENLQMEALARAAIMRAKAALLVDLQEDQSGSDDLGGGDSGLPGGGGGSGGGAAGAGSGAGGASSGGGDAGGAAGGDGSGGPAPGTHVDSLDEIWANGEFTLQIGEEAGFKTRIVISDEDSKLNLLLLFAEDENYRKEWRERFERLLDVMRDGESGDLSLSEATDLVDRIDKWMQGDRRNDELSTAPLASGDWRLMVGKAVHAPLSLSELCLVGGIKPPLLHGFAVGEEEQRRWIPGLEQVLTVWSNVEFVTEKAKEDAAKVPASVDDKKARAEAQGVNNGRINVNTAPVCVLKSLFPDSEVPYSSWDKYAEFRHDEIEDAKKQREELANLTDDEKKRKKDEEDDKVATYPLKTIDDLRKVEGFSPDSGAITSEKWTKLASYLTVESNVFTITVMIGSQGLPRRYYVARAVVWRRDQGDESQCIPIVPFERVPTSAIDMQDFAKEMEEWSEHSSGD